MTTYTFPTLSRLPRSFDFGLASNTITFQSPLSGTTQTIEFPSPRWQFNFSIENLDESDSALLQAFLVQLRGQAGRFYMYNMARPAPRGSNLGTPVVSGASQTGTTLTTSGWTISQTGVLKIGDFFSIGGELKMVVGADVNSDSGGLATITFEPPIRTSPADASFVDTSSPTAIFKLTEDVSQWVTSSPVITTFNISGVEVL